MKELIIGTTNQAKIEQIRGVLARAGFIVNGLPNGFILDVAEDGQTAQENARKKAVAYAVALGVDVLSMDNALYFDGLAPEQQPGINVRRVNGRTDRPSDEELLAYYSKLVRSLGGRVNGQWEFAVCIAKPDGEFQETTIISPRVFVGEASPKVIVGYPLESIQIDPESGKYISEMSRQEQDEFWQRKIGRELEEFVKKVIRL